MSSILKALKKVEEEKAGRKERPMEIGREILRGAPFSRGRLLALMAAGMLFAGAVAASITFVIMDGFGSSKPAASPQPVLVAAPPQGEPLQSSESMTEEKVLADEAEEIIIYRPEPSRRRAPAPPLPPQEVVPSAAEAAIPPPAVEKEQDRLTVTGIAFQQESAARMAVVNGQTVTEGAMVAGARVDEIMPDRVRFSLEGQSIEIPMGKSSP